LERLSRDELNSLLGSHQPSEIFSWKSPTAKAQGITPGSRCEEELLDLMSEEPRLLRRPLLKRGDRLLIGFNQKEWEEALSA
jgi:arsenate reductase-like glutaredoxin family protein